MVAIRVTQQFVEHVRGDTAAVGISLRVTQQFVELLRSVESGPESPPETGESGETGGTGGTGETGGGIPTPEIEADNIWPFDDLKPRHIGIYPMGAPIGGGVSLTGKEPTRDSGAGFWRFVLGGIPIKDRATIL